MIRKKGRYPTVFNNIGKKIKGLAKVIFWITFIMFVLGAIGGGIAIFATQDCEEYPAYIAAGIAVMLVGSGLGFLVSWIGSFFMYGYGQLIDDTEINRKTNQKILAQLGGEAVPEEPAAPAAPVAPVVPQEPRAEGEWFCRKCGFKNDASAKFCMRCGTPNE